MSDLSLVENLQKWEELAKEMALLEHEIIAAIMEKQETVAIGNVEARFIKPEKVYDYESAVEAYDGEIDTEAVISAHTVPKTNWYRVATGLGIDRKDVDFTEKAPRVKVKLR